MKTLTNRQTLTLVGKRFFTQLTRIKLVQRAMRIAVRIVVPTHRIGAAVILFNEQDEVLLLHHVFHGNHPWGLPGGWMDRRELPDQTARRELLEETGLSAEIGKVVLFTSSPPGHSIDMYFYANNPQGTLSCSSEINEAAWVSPDKLPRTMLPRNRQAIRLALAHHQQLRSLRTAAQPTALSAVNV